MAVAACDVYRPAAVEQLIRVGTVPGPTSMSRAPSATRSRSPPGRATRAVEGKDVLIVDTSGRLHVDEELMKELADIKQAISPKDILLVSTR